MRKIKANMFVAAGIAGILAFGVCGCSTSSESSTTVSTEVTDEDGNTTKTETTSSTKDGETETSTTTTTVIDMSTWEDAWQGETTNGQTIYYAESPDGGAQGLFVLYDPADESLYHVLGSNSSDEEGTHVTTTDAGDSGSSVTMAINGRGDDGSLEINIGDEYGDATLKPIEMTELVEAVQKLDFNGDIFA